MDISNRRLARAAAFEAAVAGAQHSLRAADPAAALQLLRRAHVLGQPDFMRHLHVHWMMLRAGWMQRDRREVVGQLIRLLLVPLGHLSGRLPAGNPGTADVSAFAPQAVPADLAHLLGPGQDSRAG